MSDQLPELPLDDATLLAIEHSLNASTTFTEDGERVRVGADYDLDTLLRFLSGTLDRSLNEQVIDPGDPDADDGDLPGFLRGVAGAPVVFDPRPRYSEHDLIAALVAEVRRLRSVPRPKDTQ